MLKSDAWRSLSGAAVRVLLELHTRFNGSNNGRLFLSHMEAAKALGMGKATVQRAFKDLECRGFIVLMNPGSWYHRKAHEWRLTFKPMQQAKGREPPSNEWRGWRAENAEHGSRTDQTGGTTVPFQNREHRHGSELEPVRREAAGG
ncbi:helix-turn-helix domain-containing protein [Jannaschia sp. W003]|uniref:helix-turn-helix domain-containing protein n=1 Tax=Jannaschia sp. W003 TaxID=2867012 RepID=UPI0021A3823A|nr:helix-turn-helix domain-containing protein [Jannaschia sp. W003]UWQ19992.1 helix-turn-helix domain-containing protein [Jannaschia sp. W003]